MDIAAAHKRIDAILLELTQLREILSENDPEFPVEARNLMAHGICLNCLKSLGSTRAVRGNHESCHKQIMRSIERGELTESQAIARGLLAPKQPGGRNRRQDTMLSATVAEIGENYKRRPPTKQEEEALLKETIAKGDEVIRKAVAKRKAMSRGSTDRQTRKRSQQ